jgi:hypothetical protein
MASPPISARLLAFACALATAVLLSAIAAGQAHAASVVGPTGQITGCYVKKGKAKGTLRVVPSGQRCRKGEKPVSWAAQGQPGSSGTSGAQGSPGQIDSLTTQISELQSRVTQLEGVLTGITNGDLLGAITNAAKLNGISTQQLTDAIDAVATVDALCTQMSTVTTQLNSVRTVLSGLSLSGVIPIGLLLNVPSIPSALSPFSCT